MRRATPVYVIGDSHSLIYNDRLVEWFGELFAFRALYCPSLKAHELIGEGGELDARVLEHMRGARLLVAGASAGDEAFHRTRSQHWRAAAVAEDRRREEPVVVLALGALDALYAVSGIPWTDLHLPPEVALHFDVPACCAASSPDALTADFARAKFAAYLEPFRAGLRALRALGFERVIATSVAPPTVKSDNFRAICASVGLAYTARRLELGFRYQMFLLTNEALRAICAEEGVPFVNRWNAHTVRGLARPALLHDAIHVCADACEATIAALLPAIGRLRSAPALAAARLAG